MSNNILELLNEQQKKAVTTTEGYVRVIAGAGSGKTRALTHRFSYLVYELGISPANILCVTFTNKAASEMKNRIRSMIGDYDSGNVCTFHSFCLSILKEDIHTFNYPKNFMILDSDDVESILKKIYKQLNITSEQFTFNYIKKEIEKKKDSIDYVNDVLPVDILQLKRKYKSETNLVEKVFLGYLYEQKKSYALDFDDLINFVVYIFKKYDDKRIKWQKKLEYVMVDEYQDVSRRQAYIADTLSGYHKNLFIVGDPDQTIYTWRGADINLILDYDKKYANTKTIIMNKNYRSTPNILDAANSLIEKNKNRLEKELIPIKSSDQPVLYYHAKSVTEESNWIADNIKKLIESKVEHGEIAILYRAHFLSRPVEECFIKSEIPYVMYSGIEFYRRREIKDVLCYLRMIIYADDISFLRVVNVPRRNFGAKRIELITNYTDNKNITLYEALKDNITQPLIKNSKAYEFISLIEKYKVEYKNMDISELFTNLLSESGYEGILRLSGDQDRLDNVAELKQSIFDYENDAGEECLLEDYLDKIALFTNSEKKDRSNAIKMMTIHNAKGLEFPYVFVCGLNEGIFPSSHANTLNALEEERRLAYVACTRAEKQLYLSESEGYNYDLSFRYPSRFIFNIEKKYLNYVVKLSEEFLEMCNGQLDAITKRDKRSGFKGEFKKGDLITHKVFGAGKIIDVSMKNKSYKIKFDKFATERNISFMVKLKKR